jgi:transcriptional regulator
MSDASAGAAALVPAWRAIRLDPLLARRIPPASHTYGHRKGKMLPSYAMAKDHTTGARLEVLQGTLDLMVLQVLEGMGPQHGYGIARRIEQVSEDILKLNEGTVYAALMRLQHRRWISASWGASENNRKAKFYAITAAGRRQLAREVETWDRLTTLIARLRGVESA